PTIWMSTCVPLGVVYTNCWPLGDKMPAAGLWSAIAESPPVVLRTWRCSSPSRAGRARRIVFLGLPDDVRPIAILPDHHVSRTGSHPAANLRRKGTCYLFGKR